MRRPGNFFSTECEILISVPPQRVFSLLSDVSSHPRWAGSGELVRARLADPAPVRLGTRFDVEERFGRRHVHVRCQVTAFDPPRELRWQVSQVNRPPVMRSEWGFELESRNVGTGTLLRHQWDLDRPTTLGWRVAMWIFFRLMGRGRKMAAAMRRSLENIKQEVEARVI